MPGYFLTNFRFIKSKHIERILEPLRKPLPNMIGPSVHLIPLKMTNCTHPFLEIISVEEVPERSFKVGRLNMQPPTNSQPTMPPDYGSDRHDSIQVLEHMLQPNLLDSIGRQIYFRQITDDVRSNGHDCMFRLREIDINITVEIGAPTTKMKAQRLPFCPGEERHCQIGTLRLRQLLE